MWDGGMEFEKDGTVLLHLLNGNWVTKYAYCCGWFWAVVLDDNYFYKVKQDRKYELEPLNHSRFLETETSRKSQSVY